MTWQDFQSCCDGIFLHPRLWQEQMELFAPDLFFCEAAWTGIKKYEGVWRGRVYRDRRLLFDNRRVLLDILAYCRTRGIPTVFWGKEDPTFFEHPVYDFTQTALDFDFIFTTAEECVERYRALGHPRVELLPFGVDTERFYPVEAAPEPGSVVFAGSWFGDQPERCAALERLLDFSLSRGLRLDIYDRKWGSKQKRFRFPDKYRAYLRPSVPYEETAALFHRYEYAINVNSVTDSATMCSRRLLQLAANGTAILTNETPVFSGLRDCLETFHRRTGAGLCPWEPGADLGQVFGLSSVFQYHSVLSGCGKGARVPWYPSGLKTAGSIPLCAVLPPCWRRECFVRNTVCCLHPGGRRSFWSNLAGSRAATAADFIVRCPFAWAWLPTGFYLTIIPVPATWCI